MKIKRFFAKDIRQVMGMVKEELGEDAVILSNRYVEGGIEIVAARDFDEQMIQNKVREQSPEPQQAPANKSTIVQMPNFQEEKKRSEILSVGENKNHEVLSGARNGRGSIDQFVGYAEKMQLRGQEDMVSVNQIKPAAPDQHVEREKSAEKARTTETKPVTLSDKLLIEMYRDLKSLRAEFDKKMGETGATAAPQVGSVRTKLLQRLAEMGISKKSSIIFANQLNTHATIESAFAKAQEIMAEMLPIAQDDLLDVGGVVALIGPTGVGKTTTIAKLASKFILKHGPSQVALITTDNYRIGAHEQINTYGRILGVPVRVASSSEDLRNLLAGLVNKRLILIDTAGMSQRDMKLVEQINTLRQSAFSIKFYLVMSAATEYRVMNEIINAFRFFDPQACILTKFDEAVTAGAALSSLIEQNLPLSYITNGQRVPEDMFSPVAQTFVSHCVAESKSENNCGDFEYHEMFIA